VRILRWGILIYAPLFLTVVTLHPQQRAADATEASRIWEQMIDAKGGRSNLYRIETMVEETRDYFVYLYPIFAHGKAHSVKVYAFPNGEWRWDTAPIFGDVVQTADLSAGVAYIGYPKNDIRKGTDVRWEKEDLKNTQLVYLNETKWVKPKPVRVLLDKEIPKKVEAIETDLDGERIEFWVDRKNHLPVRIITYYQSQYRAGLQPGYTWDLSDYQPMNGIQIPNKISMIVLSGNPGTRRFTTVLNPKLREDLFTSPPRFEDGPEAWKGK